MGALTQGQVLESGCSRGKGWKRLRFWGNSDPSLDSEAVGLLLPSQAPCQPPTAPALLSQWPVVARRWLPGGHCCPLGRGRMPACWPGKGLAGIRIGACHPVSPTPRVPSVLVGLHLGAESRGRVAWLDLTGKECWAPWLDQLCLPAPAPRERLQRVFPGGLALVGRHHPGRV